MTEVGGPEKIFTFHFLFEGEGGDQDHEPRNAGSLSELEQARQEPVPSSLQKEHSPADSFLAQWDISGLLDFQNYKIIALCCFKPQGLWLFVTAWLLPLSTWFRTIGGRFIWTNEEGFFFLTRQNWGMLHKLTVKHGTIFFMTPLPVCGCLLVGLTLFPKKLAQKE